MGEREPKRRILVFGLASTPLPGGMDRTNIGNYTIVEPMFKLLRETFKEAEIRTSLRLNEEFIR